MDDISDDDWRTILEAYREAYPDHYPDRSMIIGEMVQLYVASITPTHEAATVDALASTIATSPAFQTATGTNDANEARSRIMVADDGSSVSIMRSTGGPRPISLRACRHCRHWVQRATGCIPSRDESGKYTMMGVGGCGHPSHAQHQTILLWADNFCADFTE